MNVFKLMSLRQLMKAKALLNQELEYAKNDYLKLTDRLSEIDYAIEEKKKSAQTKRLEKNTGSNKTAPSS